MAKAKAEPHLGKEVCVIMRYPDGHTKERVLEWNDDLQRYIFKKDAKCTPEMEQVTSERFAAMKYKPIVEMLGALATVGFRG